MSGARRLFSTRPRRVLAGLGLTLLFVLHLMGGLRLPLLDTLDRVLYDARLQLHHVQPQPKVVIVDVDEKSLAAEGRWPWSREKIARLTEQLAGPGGAAVVGYDIVFAEPEGGDRQALIDRLAGDPAYASVRPALERLAADLDYDSRLAEVLGQHPVVLSYYFTSDRGGRMAGALPAPVLDADDLRRLGYRVTSWNGFGANLPAIQQAARYAGFFNPRLDADGIVRELPVLAEYDGALYESFAMSVLRAYLGQAVLGLDDVGIRLRGERGALSMPMTGDATVLVPFAGSGGPAGGRFAYLSASDVLEGRFDPGLVRDAIVLVGTSAPGLTDLRATPVSEVFPGVEIHASVIAGALEGSLRTRPAGDAMLGAILLALVGIFLAFAMPAMAMPGVAFTTGIAMLTLTGWGSIAYSNLGWVLPLAPGLALVAALAVVNLAAGYFVEGRAKRAVVERFGEYVAPQVVERMVRNPHSYRLDSENRELTILFADIRGFTRIAEAMEPHVLREYINEFLTAMTEVIHSYNGTVDKYIGDAVMAFWGAPMHDPLHADHAVAAAIAMQKEIKRLNARFETRGWPPLAMGVGVNTGLVRVGDMGSRLRRAYTVIGDAVNMAARFESLTKRFDAGIIVGEATMRAAHGHWFHEIGRVQLAGRSEDVRIFEPLESGRGRPRRGESADLTDRTLPRLVDREKAA